MSILIACHGLPGSGKDTFANFLIQSEMNWSKVSFAAPLKRGLSTMFNIPLEDIENPTLKNAPNYKFGHSIRYMAQTLGTEWGRNLIKESVWIDLAEEAIHHAWNNNQNVINTDLRFENEAIKVKELGGIIVHIIRPENKFNDENNMHGAKEHKSNIILDSKYIDYTIINNGSLEDFHKNISIILGKIIN